MVEVGQPAPDFTARDQCDRDVTLAQYRGRRVILYFYPRDETPGCTKQACTFRDGWDRLEAEGAIVLGVSPDGVASHAKFAARHKLPFTLLADPGRKLCELYGVWQERSLYGRKSMGVVRTTFVIDGEGVVQRVFPKVKVEGHAAAVLGALSTVV